MNRRGLCYPSDLTDAEWALVYPQTLGVKAWPLPQERGYDKPNANVRQILGRPGEVWAPESGTSRLVVYRTR
jgi:streptogramin lyase